MRTHLSFRSDDFPACEGEDAAVNPGRHGKRLADFLAAGLPAHGFAATSVGAEDWGWMVELENEAFPLWIGCGNDDDVDNGFLCFIEPSKPFVRKWFSRIPTEPVVEAPCLGTGDAAAAKRQGVGAAVVGRGRGAGPALNGAASLSISLPASVATPSPGRAAGHAPSVKAVPKMRIFPSTRLSRQATLHPSPRQR